MAPTGVEDSTCDSNDVTNDCSGVIIAGGKFKVKIEVGESLSAIDEEDTTAKHRLSMSSCTPEEIQDAHSTFVSLNSL